jgi:hypothetical protein
LPTFGNPTIPMDKLIRTILTEARAIYKSTIYMHNKVSL